jgi:hypothetical protein
MTDDLTLPDFLDRKKNPVTEDRKPSQLRYVHKDGLVWPPARDWSAAAEKKRAEAREENALTAGEQDELIEIKAMAKTNIGLAKRMASEWLTRTIDRKAIARRRLALKEVKGLR